MGSAARRLLPYVNRYRRAFVIGMACVSATTTFQLLSPWVLKYAIDDLNAGVTRGKLASYAALLLGISLVRGIFLFLMRRIIIGASRDIEYDIRNDFFARLEQLPLGYYHVHRTGDLMSRATNDLNAVRMMIGPAIMYSANTVLVFVVAIVLMLTIDLRLTLIALIPLPFVSLSVRYFGSAIHKRFEAIQAQLSDVSAVVQEAFVGRPRRAGVPAGGARARPVSRVERRVPAQEPRADPAAGRVLSEHDAVPGAWLAARPVARQPRRDSRPHHARRVRRVQRLSRHVELADDRVRLGHEHPPARDSRPGNGCSTVLDQAPTISDADVTPAGRAAALDGDIEIRNLTFQYPASDHAGARRRQPAHRGRSDGGVRGRHRIGQIDADQPAAAAARPAARARSSSAASTSGRSRSTGCAARSGSCRRSRSSSPTRSAATSPSARRRTRRALREADPPRRVAWLVSTRTSRNSRAATRRRSGSAASRCPAARSSGPRWRAR